MSEYDYLTFKVIAITGLFVLALYFLRASN